MCRECYWEEIVDRIDVMINDADHRFAFAYDTLCGIKDSVEKYRHATPGQVHAIYKIETAGKRRR